MFPQGGRGPGDGEVSVGLLTVLVAELVLRPHTALAAGAVNRVDKPVRPAEIGVGAGRLQVAQQPRRHAGPGREHDEGEQVAHGHGPSAGLVQGRAGRRPGPLVFVVVLVVAVTSRLPLDLGAVAHDGVVVQPAEEEDGSRDVDERVDAVDPVHHGLVPHEGLLDLGLPEDLQPLLPLDHLERVVAGDIDGARAEGERRDGTADLVDLPVYYDLLAT